MTLAKIARTIALFALPLIAFTCFPQAGYCSAGMDLDGSSMSIFWVIPFACMLLSIAVLPLTSPMVWHHHFGKIAVFWALCFLIPCAIAFGPGIAFYQFLHTILLEYAPFLILLFALFTVAGGIRLKGSLVGSPMVNTIILATGTLLASWMGTTGAAMLLIRPILRANAHRRYRTHTVVFFIFLVANAGGCLTPLGDPPLFLGFLKGVRFFWTLEYLLVPMLFLCAILLILHHLADTYYYNKEGKPQGTTETNEKLGLEGTSNFLLLAGVVAAVLMSGIWKPGIIFPLYGVELELQNLARDLILLGIAFVSLKTTSQKTRELNDFNWGPIAEVGKLFFGIFISMIPAIAILQAGKAGALGSVVNLVTSEAGEPINVMYFWLSGVLSSFLDNAPTYLVFFNTAGGDPLHLMGEMAATLMAISAGAVFMGANTYIGNAPNFMVRAIAEDMGVKMPSFFGYMAWSGCILIPCFVIMSFLFF